MTVFDLKKVAQKNQKLKTKSPLNSVARALQDISTSFEYEISKHAESFCMLIHLMVNQIYILEVDDMNRLANKMYKFSKYFHLIDN